MSEKTIFNLTPADIVLPSIDGAKAQVVPAGDSVKVKAWSEIKKHAVVEGLLSSEALADSKPKTSKAAAADTSGLEAEVAAKEKEIADLTKQLEAKDAEIADLNKQLEAATDPVNS